LQDFSNEKISFLQEGGFCDILKKRKEGEEDGKENGTEKRALPHGGERGRL
jgi:hypothetical protein